MGQSFRADIRMQVGTLSDSVEVTAEVAQLTTENGMIKGDVIVQQEIQDLPLNGRDFTELALLVPGVVPNAQGGAGSFASINGARGDNTNFYVDGFNDRNVRGAAAQLRPNIDAMQEFKMEVSGYSAEYGKMAGGVLNMVLRSGTNQYHGSFFEYVRNDKFDARAYFDREKLGFHQNQFGSTVTGPLTIPKVYNGRNRTFFMASFEGYRLSWGQTRVGVVPTALQHVGDFSKTVSNTGVPITVRNPYASNQPFAGNIIPASLFSPVAKKIVDIYPLPNRVALGNNHQAIANNVNTWDSFVMRFDHKVHKNDNLAVRYGKRFGRNNAPWAGSNLGVFQNTVRDDRLLGGIDYTHMFTSNIIMEARFGVSRNASREKIISDGSDMAKTLGIGGSTSDPLLRGFPLIAVTNYLSIGYAANQPVQYYVTAWQWGYKLTWIKGKHVMKFGLDYSRYQFNQPYFNNSRGTMTANGVWTGGGTATNGNAYGDLLLGLLNSSSHTSQTTRNYMREQGYGFFFNDDFKLSRRLTLNLGMRYEIEMPAYDKYDRMSNWLPQYNKIIIASTNGIGDFAALVEKTGSAKYMAMAKDYGLPRSLVHPYYKGVAPRVGFAYRLRGDRTVLRGGYGIFYAGQLLNDVRNGLDNTFPFILADSFSRLAADTTALTLANPFNPARGTTAGGGTGTTTGFKVDAPMGYLQSYNLTIERSVGSSNVIEIGYVGSKGTHLGRQYNINLPLRSLEYFLAFGTGFPNPYLPFTGTINYWDFGSNSIYSTGQITLRRRARGGIFYRLNYSYSKSIDTNSQFTGASDGGFAQALDPRNLSLERARSDWDRGHVMTTSFSYPLPVGAGKRVFSNAGRIVNGVVGGWTLSGTAVAYSGQPFTILDSTINANLGESSRPNRIAAGNNTSGQGRKGIDYPWYNPAAFVHTPGCVNATPRVCTKDQYGFIPFAPGNSGRNILDGPGLFNTNLTMMKNFWMAERKRVQIRWETFNIWNHPNFQLPNRNYNETAAGVLSSAAASGNGGPRVMQFALRYEF
ncbi:MAG: TonB-dependent receptor plug domain-containing protein [Candidatus Solibacter usitatus]|nr:TonB-dependent receptor plug domain-containing protein [Candidatus Solibacter usitatus]